MIETGSYQMNVDNLIKYLNINEHEARKLIKRSVEIAKIAKKEAQCGIY